MNDVSGEEVLSEAGTLYDRWPKLAPDEKRKITEAIIEKIVIGEGEIDLILSYLPASEELCKCQQQMATVTGYAASSASIGAKCRCRTGSKWPVRVLPRQCQNQ